MYSSDHAASQAPKIDDFQIEIAIHDFILKIIDYDIAIKVEDENTEMCKYCGTMGWTAPEIGKEDGPMPMYRPIKADRWSCGHVILRHHGQRYGHEHRPPPLEFG